MSLETDIVAKKIYYNMISVLNYLDINDVFKLIFLWETSMFYFGS